LDNQLISLYSEKQFKNLSTEFLKNIDLYGRSLFVLNEKNYKALCNFVETFLTLFIKADFIIPTDHIEQYFHLHPYISSMVAISKTNNTDHYLEQMLKNKFSSQNEFIRILLLYSSRNCISLNYNNLFDFDHKLSSLWYLKYFDTDNYVSQVNYLNFQRHLDYFDQISDRLDLLNSPSTPYTSSTYVNPKKDKKIKLKMNETIKEWYQNIVFFNKPEPKKIGIISRSFFRGHSVYRGTFPFLEALKDDYDLTLIHLGKMRENIETGIFKNVVQLEVIGDNFDHSKLDNNFSLVYYPDTGISAESMILSNLRLAPVQVTGHGHSVSTYGSEIDYFITGSDCEVMENLMENYSERVVVIPGIGLCPVFPDYTPISLWNGQKLGLPIPEKNGEFIIICPWSKRKINYPHLLNLKKIIENSSRKIKFRFFPSIKNDSKLHALGKEIAGILGKKNFEIYASCNYQKYMSLIEESDLVIDSFHFGGYNTIIDALYLYKPFITLEGNKAYNKFAAAVLRSVGLDELIAVNSEEYVNKVLMLINNDAYRDSLLNKMKSGNLYDKIFKTGIEKYFKTAIELLLKNNNQLKSSGSREPIIIKPS
jgi:predicted O-linked N-acetylglucosamine transferase (SPINDLY family)